MDVPYQIVDADTVVRLNPLVRAEVFSGQRIHLRTGMLIRSVPPMRSLLHRVIWGYD